MTENTNLFGDYTQGFSTWNPVISITVAAIVFVLMYKDEKAEVVTFSCLSWQPPTGSEKCEVCNEGDLPCSEYRCKSLGQSCELVNEGTSQEQCVSVNVNDVNPPVIRPNQDALTFGYKYTNVVNSPPSPGFKIEQDSVECLKAFTPLEFGILTDEPAQCKVDLVHTTTYDEMSTYFGGSNLFSYNHTENLVLPSAQALANSSIVLANGQDMSLFIRCSDKNGNYNSAEYEVRLCVDPTPDTTPPVIKATSVIQNGCVAEDVTTANVDFYTNEPSECKWSHTDQEFNVMTNNMNCANQLYQLNGAQLFTCSTSLSGIARDLTNFYVRCKDGVGKAENERNGMSESFKFSLRGSTGLSITTIKPNETIFGGVSPAPVELYVETKFGCDSGKAICFYSDEGVNGDYIAFFDTNNVDGVHTQRQDLVEDDYEYAIKCVDSGGNAVVDTINFGVEIDEDAPVIARIYEEDLTLKIVTIKNSQCSYSLNNCNFNFEEGIEMPYDNSEVHFVEWNPDKTYYIKCRDEFNNEEASCSAIVKPSSNFL